MLYIGADHRGFELKKNIKEKLNLHKYAFEDLGANEFNADDDYTDIAVKVAEKVADLTQTNADNTRTNAEKSRNRGILLCGSGAGVCVAANKVKKIRAALIDNIEIAKKAREDDDINILCLPADFIEENLIWELIEIFLNTEFISNANRIRRIQKIQEYENK